MQINSFDLAIARTDNQVDMRYLINMDYSADLPINSMGRRVRSRLYFTSESHLHSLLNVLRFASAQPESVTSPLSVRGQEILASASELCYLTQVVIRLFEDTQKPAEDPRRFRVEIWFSPGATATPLHMAELHRENDATRFDTEKLQKISIDGLSCAQVEKYFAESIKEGKPKREEAPIEQPPKGKKDKASKEMKVNEEGNEAVDVAEYSVDDKRSDQVTEQKLKDAVVEETTKSVQEGSEGGMGIVNEEVKEAPMVETEYSTTIDDNDQGVDTTDRNQEAGIDSLSSKKIMRALAVFGVAGIGCVFMLSRMRTKR